MQLNFALGCLTVVTVAISVQARMEPPDGKGSAARVTSIKDLGCEIIEENSNDLKVVCNHVQSMQEILPHFTSDQLPKITDITFTRSNFLSLSLDDLADLPSLRTLGFNQSRVADWKKPQKISLPKVTAVILDDCWNNVNLLTPHRNASLQFTVSMFDGLQLLEQLFLVNCYVSNMTANIFGNLTKLYISNGSGIGCEPEMEWVLDWIIEGRAFVANDTKCFVPRDLTQGGGVLIMSTFYSFLGHPFLLIMGHRKETKKYCPKECSCVVEGFNSVRNGRRQRNDPIINIYCDHAGLMELPDLPPYSTRISLTHNNITDISKLFTDENYRAVTSIRLGHNLLSSLDGDLFYNFLKGRSHDLFIALNNNHFSTLPVKKMVRFYKEARDADAYNPIIALDLNPWDCGDCSFLPEFQELVYYQYYVREKGLTFYDDIRCAKGSDFFADQMIIKLDVQSLCAPEPPLLEPMDILNIALALVIIVVVANFVHNYYQYRQHSKLPWIITKGPCC